MSKSEDKKIAALARKNAAKSRPKRPEDATQFDPTLRLRAGEEDAETRRLFKEMKRREF